ncbi:oxoglutarate/iron-dependent dioxygenase [Tanacetum coccineum]
MVVRSSSKRATVIWTKEKASTKVVGLSPMEPAWDMVPEMYRVALADWDKAVVDLAKELMLILYEGPHHRNNFPYEPAYLTMLVQNEVGDLLQVKCGEEWADIEAVLGAIVINIGDMLQMMSNDEYKSVEHRLLATPNEVACVSVAVLSNPSNQERLYGPLPELISAEKPAVYQELFLAYYMRRFLWKTRNG